MKSAGMRNSVVVWIVVYLLSCSPFTALRKQQATYTVNGQLQTVRLRVPKRYAKTWRVDSAGAQQQWYRYSNGALLYMIYTADTLAQFQPIDTAHNVSRPYPYGGLMYKGLDSARLFWRELRTDSFRFGYRFVPGDQEILFDSAVNYAGRRRSKK